MRYQSVGYAYGNSVSARHARKVWAAVTQLQQRGGPVTLRKLADHMGYRSPGSITSALRVLRDLGYVVSRGSGAYVATVGLYDAPQP